MDKQLEEMKKFEEDKFQLPDWYKGWCLANQRSIHERPPEYVYEATKARNQLLRILESKEWFILAKPERTLLDCKNYLDQVIQAYKLFHSKKKAEDAVVNRNLLIGIPGGNTNRYDLYQYHFEDYEAIYENQAN